MATFNIKLKRGDPRPLQIGRYIKVWFSESSTNHIKIRLEVSSPLMKLKWPSQYGKAKASKSVHGSVDG